MKLNSVIFHTSKLAEIRDFYEGKLNLPTGTLVRENQTIDDFSDGHVNYYLDGGLLCFEAEATCTDIGTIVLSVKDFPGFRDRVENAGIKVLSGSADYFKIKDPEGRSLIVEPIR